MPVGDNKVWLRDMVREVKTFERLHHPNIVEYKHSWLELSRRSEFCPFVPLLAKERDHESPARQFFSLDGSMPPRSLEASIELSRSFE